MSFCLKCGLHLEPSFVFCPRCGTPKDTTVQAQSIYEEGTIHIAYTGRFEEQVADNANYSHTWGNMRTKQVMVFFFELSLIALHPQKGRYAFCKSLPIRDIFVDVTDRGWDQISYRYEEKMRGNRYIEECRSAWYTGIVQERKVAWQQFNDHLLTSTWLGITERAKKREEAISLTGLGMLPRPWRDKFSFGGYRDFGNFEPFELDQFRFGRTTR